MTFDPNKSIILWCQGQSNMVGRGEWVSSSSTGLYAPYDTAKSTLIDSKLLCWERMEHIVTYSSDYRGSLFEEVSGFNSHSIPDENSINMMYSFMIELMTYLNSINYTKNVYYLNHALGGTSLQQISGMDWGTDYEIFYESSVRLRDTIKHEFDVNGNSSQVICFWHQGEADQNDSANHLTRLNNLYTRQRNVIGYDHPFFMGQLVPQNANRIAMNQVFSDFSTANANVHVVGEGLAQSTWDQMEADDPDNVILGNTPSSYTSAGDNTHYDWRAQILQGRQLYDLVIDNYFT